MSRKWKYILIAPLALAAIVFFIWLGGALVMWLWNWLTPSLFGWRHITFWQALGILLLCRILFGGFGMRGSGGSNLRRRMRERMAERMEERCANMTPEEREHFRQRMRERWGFGPPTGESKGQ